MGYWIVDPDPEENWENEGGRPRQPCAKCGRLVPLYKNGLCAICYLGLTPPKV